MLSDLNILIVEDEALVAMDLSMIVEEMGAAVAGKCSTVEEAMTLIDKGIDAAILDVELDDDLVFPVADRLIKAGTSVVFHTGRCGPETIKARYGDDIPVLVKPTYDHMIVTALQAVKRRKLH
ncbi:hypothetical protein JANAI62_15500 [Jannaschia pagri]|uniref:Response regulatory domain-containing protein n=1 Tax=Jannaschia pagri TaxID=2829797 RepID=A0ABQ4NKI1_9RHOB|nr:MULTISPECIES: response regulator [unclassified Jannaschia]GIT91095.1 hypothetical protein JANAI61_15530 [Jannaschia sp. AI_61]GIT94927.1 hypothetical protein JANAI62_15500 [Jannaschia sp. AI_62]